MIYMTYVVIIGLLCEIFIYNTKQHMYNKYKTFFERNLPFSSGIYMRSEY